MTVGDLAVHVHVVDVHAPVAAGSPGHEVFDPVATKGGIGDVSRVLRAAPARAAPGYVELVALGIPEDPFRMLAGELPAGVDGISVVVDPTVRIPGSSTVE